MKTLNKTLLIAVLLATPFAGAQARDQAAHDAWIKAQKIDIQPTLKVTETEIPADAAASGSQAPASGLQPDTTSGAANRAGTGLVPPAPPPMESRPYPGTDSTMPKGTTPYPVNPSGQRQ